MATQSDKPVTSVKYRRVEMACCDAGCSHWHRLL